jgi:hypothetical protein
MNGAAAAGREAAARAAAVKAREEAAGEARGKVAVAVRAAGPRVEVWRQWRQYEYERAAKNACQ